jgi:hypothetical protein
MWNKIMMCGNAVRSEANQCEEWGILFVGNFSFMELNGVFSFLVTSCGEIGYKNLLNT